MVDTIKFLDPVQGLVDYVNDIKPYHSKVIESLVEYVSREAVDVVVGEEYLLDVGLDFSYDIGIISCEDNGFGALGFGDPENFSVLSPNPSETVTTFPAIGSNTFIVLGDQRLVFDPTANLIFKLSSFVEEKIIGIILPTGSPLIGGGFVVTGDQTNIYLNNLVFSVTGSFFNDTSYKTTSNATFDNITNTTTIYIDGQQILSNDISGFISVRDNNNFGSFSVTGSVFTEGNTPLVPYTTVFIAGLVLTPPSGLGPNQRYISKVSIAGVEYKKILSYSNALKYYDSSIPSLLHTPDEGVMFATIIDLSQGSPSYFEVDGNYEGSNLFIGDEFTVTGSTDNNAVYNITFISYDIINDTTKFGVSSIHDSSVDGFVKLDIPSNVFIVDGDYAHFFKQGVRLSAITGSLTGNYTVLYSKFINNETRIRVQEDLIHGRGSLIVSSTSTSFIVDGDLTITYRTGIQFNVHSSLRNDGQYTTAANSIYDALAHTTTIAVTEPFDSTDSTGEIHEFAKGMLTYRNTGFGQTPDLCDVIPETIVNVRIKDKLYIDGLGIWTRDNILAYGIDKDDWGYDLPSTTIFTSSGGSPTIGPNITQSDIPPASPLENMLWFDTLSNTGSPSGPGILKQYVQVLVGSPPSVIGSPPTLIWIEVPNNKAYWVDTNTNYMYYRTIYQYYDNAGSPSAYITPIDTGWILEYTKIPGFNDHIVGAGTREQQGFETFFAVESSTSVAETTFTFTGSPLLTIPTIGSPPIPNHGMLEVYVNNTIADVNIISPISFDVISPRLRVGDFIEARVFDDTALASNVWIGAFNTNAAISETFDMLLGYKFHIDGTESTGSPVVNKIHIPDTTNGDVYNIFMQGSPPTLVDNIIEITASVGSPNNDGVYTILSVSQEGSPTNHVVLTVAEPLLDSGIFSASPVIDAGKALYQQWFQYIIVNTTVNTIVVLGDATNDIQTGDQIKITHSTGNNETYTVNGIPLYDGRNTTIITTEAITNIGNSGGWVESI